MANQEQLEILKQGTDIWNNWRRKNAIWAPDLVDADLNGVNLSGGVKLDRANLYGASLIEANLESAELKNANLSHTSLHRANLKSAHMVETDISESDLGQADLGGARLHKAKLVRVVFARDANLSGTDLSEADLSESHLSNTNFGGANMRQAILRGAYLRGADLSDTWLHRANLNGAQLIDANFSRTHLTEANLIKADLSGANLSNADLSKANLENAILEHADLGNANLTKTNLKGANLNTTQLFQARIIDAKLNNANLFGADLMGADLTGSDLTGATLARTVLVSTKIDRVKISRSWVYAVNVWDLEGEFSEQKDLIISHKGQPIITVDNIEIAQFIYLILNNERIRDVINTLTSRSVLILGRFAIPERKAILDALRNKLREYNLLPIVFDFDRPTDKDFTETIKTLAGLSYFVIADVTNPKSSPLELQATVPDYQIPFVPIIQEGENPFAMMVDLQKKYNWVLNTVTYDSMETLIKVLKPLIIDPAMKKRQELRIIKAQEPEVISGKDFLAKGTK